MEFSLTEGSKLKLLKRIVSIMSRVSEDLVIDATSSCFSLNCIDSCTSIFISNEFQSDFFDNYSFSLSERVLRSIPSKHFSNILKSFKFNSLVFRVISNEKIIIILTDIFNSTHKYTLYVSETDYTNVPEITGCFSTIDGPSDIFQSTSRYFESKTELSIFTLGKNAFRIEKNMDEVEKGSVMLTVLKSDSCKIDARFKAKLKVMFSDVIISAQLANVYSKKMIIIIQEGGPITIKADNNGLVQMKSTVAAQNVENDVQEDTEDEEILVSEQNGEKERRNIIFTKTSKTAGILTGPPSSEHLLNQMNSSRVEAPYLGDERSIPSRRQRTII